MSTSDSHPDPLAELAEEFAGRYRKGQRPSLAEYADRHPELAERIRRLFPALVLMEEFGSAAATGPFEPDSDGEEPVSGHQRKRVGPRLTVFIRP